MADNNGNSNNTSKSSSFLLTAESGSTSSQFSVFLEIDFGASFLRDRAITDALAADIATAATTATTTAGPRKYSQSFLPSQCRRQYLRHLHDRYGIAIHANSCQ
jgi:hypothetical protein